MASGQFNSLCGFIQDFYIELTSVAKFTPDRAWKLVGCRVGQVFEAQRHIRSKVANLHDLGVITNKAKIMWAVLKCHNIVTQFVNVGFCGHPKIVKEIGLFMLTERVDPDTFLALQTKVTETHKSVATVLSSAQKDNDKWATQNRTNLQHKSDIGNLRTDIKTLKEWKDKQQRA